MDIQEFASPDAPTKTNEQGGSQSDIPRFDLIDANAMFAMARVLDQGARKYGDENWRLVSVRDHLNHLLMHTFAYLAGDESDEHLSHILCRATFAQGVSLQGPNQFAPGRASYFPPSQRDSSSAIEESGKEHTRLWTVADAGSVGE